MNRNKQSSSDYEKGQVSMITVAVFMMIFTILIVGFTYLAMNSMRQSVNDSINASATNAAEAGVEDAKRMLKYCYGHRHGDGSYDSWEGGDWKSSIDVPFCKTVIGKLEGISSVTCTTVLDKLNTSSKKNNFGVVSDGHEGYLVPVGSTGVSADGSDGTNEQYYQCLKIYTLSQTYVGKLTGDGRSIVVPLRLVDKNGIPATATEITIKWHKLAAVSANGDGSVTAAGLNNLGNNSVLPNKRQWNTAGNVPALLRVQSARAAQKNPSIKDISNDSATVYLRPGNGGIPPTSHVDLNTYRLPRLTDRSSGGYSYDTSTATVNSGGSNPVVTTKCSTTGDYSCTTKLTFPGGFNAGTYNWYLRLQAIYRDAHFQVSAKSGSDSLYFDGVQPVVDVTGKSSDSFSRVRARIEPLSSSTPDDVSSWWPEYTVDTGGKVCKKIDVKYDKGDPHC